MIKHKIKNINDFIKDENNIYIFKSCIQAGLYCSSYRHKNYFNEWLINSISIIERYNSYEDIYGKDIYFNIEIYCDKTGNHKPFDNGYHYHTQRVVKLKDILLTIKKEKLKHILYDN